MTPRIVWKAAFLLIALSFLASCWKYKDDLDPETIGTLFKAVEDGDVAMIRKLYEKNPKIVDARDPAKQRTPLMCAAIYKQPAIAEFLIKNGADVTIKDRYTGQTALHFAADADSGDVAGLLLDAGANPDQKDNFGRSARELANMNDRKSVMQQLDRR